MSPAASGLHQNAGMERADLLVTGAELVATVDDARREIAGGWVAVTGGRGQRRSAARPTRGRDAVRTVDAPTAAW